MAQAGLKGPLRRAGHNGDYSTNEYRALTMELLDMRCANAQCSAKTLMRVRSPHPFSVACSLTAVLPVFVSQELEMMGGGDTRISKLNLVVRLRPPRYIYARAYNTHTHAISVVCTHSFKQTHMHTQTHTHTHKLKCK